MNEFQRHLAGEIEQRLHAAGFDVSSRTKAADVVIHGARLETWIFPDGANIFGEDVDRRFEPHDYPDLDTLAVAVLDAFHQALLERHVILWIAEWRDFNARELSPTTFINRGKGSLGVDGADADEMFEFLIERSGVSFERFNHFDYFGPETFNPVWIPLLPLIWWLHRHDPRLTIRTVAKFIHVEQQLQRLASASD